MKNLSGLMKQASQMQAKMQEMQARVEAMVIEGQSGAGMVKVSLSGGGVLKAVVIDPKLADPTEIDMLQDLIVTAHADAKRKLDAAMQAEMAQVTGGIELPPGLKLPF
ncbi:MAG TPA: YbaB/EbfC family nucleoid-associated protein [Acetobacteraceae bacterium]|nr:YbaB/EbfC family nucleoid-associated protein [Acetobacteraceae bacterium]